MESVDSAGLGLAPRIAMQIGRDEQYWTAGDILWDSDCNKNEKLHAAICRLSSRLSHVLIIADDE